MKIFFNTGFVCAVLSLSVSAAPIDWGPATDVYSPTEVINSGTLIEAFNAGGDTSGTNVTVNGELFVGTTAFLSKTASLSCFSGDTGDAAYNALLNSADYGNGGTLQVGGGNLVVGTEYTIQVWYADTGSVDGLVHFGDGESTPNEVELNCSGQFATGTFVADGSTQTLTVDKLSSHLEYINAYQIRDRVSTEEMMGHFDGHLSGFPDYSWDKITRWALARYRFSTNEWTAADIDLVGGRCKYFWLPAEPDVQEEFLAAYPDNMYCFDAYMNPTVAYELPDPFLPEYFLYDSNGTGARDYRTGKLKYNLANPDCREWWLDTLAAKAYEFPQTDVLFIDAMTKVQNIDDGDYYDYWGNPVSDGFMEKGEFRYSSP